MFTTWFLPLRVPRHLEIVWPFKKHPGGFCWGVIQRHTMGTCDTSCMDTVALETSIWRGKNHQNMMDVDKRLILERTFYEILWCEWNCLARIYACLWQAWLYIYIYVSPAVSWWRSDKSFQIKASPFGRKTSARHHPQLQFQFRCLEERSGQAPKNWWSGHHVERLGFYIYVTATLTPNFYCKEKNIRPRSKKKHIIPFRFRSGYFHSISQFISRANASNASQFARFAMGNKCCVCDTGFEESPVTRSFVTICGRLFWWHLWETRGCRENSRVSKKNN